MTVAQYAVPTTRGSSRWLLLGSLALNLFFVGVAVAMAVRAPAPPAWDRNVFVRVEHIADTLPPSDADLLRGQINANRQIIDDAQTKYHSAQDAIHAALRQRAFRRRRHARRHGADAGGAAVLRSGHPGGLRVSRRRRCRRPAARPWPTGRRAAKQRAKRSKTG